MTALSSEVRRPSLSPHPALPMGRSVHRPSAGHVWYCSWVWGITCVKERRLQSQRTSCEVLLSVLIVIRDCPQVPRLPTKGGKVGKIWRLH